MRGHWAGLVLGMRAVGIGPIQPMFRKWSVPVQETRVQSLGYKDPLEKELATHSSVLPWRIHGQRKGSQGIGHN